MPTIKAGEFERMRNGGARTSVRVQPTGTAVTGYQVPLGNRPSIRDVGVVGAPAWTAEQSETWARIERLSATCPRRLVVFEGGKKDIDRCMEFGDDFDGAAINPAKWATRQGSISVSGGVVTLTGAATSAKLLSSYGAGSSHAIRIRGSETITGSGLGLLAGNSSHVFLGGYWYAGKYNTYTQNAGLQEAFSDIGTIYTGTNLWEILRNGANQPIYKINGAAVTPPTSPNGYYSGNLTAYLEALTNNSNIVTADWLLVRKYTPNEPIAGTAQPSALNRSMCQSLNLADGLRACCAA